MGLHNIPLENYGTKVNISKLPEDFVAKISEENTIHFSRNPDGGASLIVLCGRVFKKETSFKEAPRSQFCIACLRKLNENMEGYMYDEKNEVYYNPTDV